MVVSQFNIYSRKGRSFYIYNTLNQNIVEVCKPDYMQLKNNNAEGLLYHKDYAKSGLIVGSQDEEFIKIKNQYLNEQNNSDTIIITIALTLNCNFRCPYCYEDKTKYFMTESDQLAFLKFLDNQLKTKQFKTLLFTWFGGEPLLTIDSIVELNKKIENLCKKYAVNKIAFMSTNGYLINENNIEKIKSLHLENCYITIDGPQKQNDKTRILANGKGTFQKIIENLHLLQEKNIPYCVRCNVNKKNFRHAIKLNKFLKNNQLKHQNMFLGHIQNFTESCAGCDSNCLTKKQFAKKNLLFKKQCKKKMALPQIKNTFCRAASASNFVIDPYLNLFQCENDIGRDDKLVGKISKNGQTIIKEENKYISWDPFSYEKCMHCKCLPVCMGGCLFMGIKQGEPQCPTEKYNIKKTLKEYIKSNC